MIWLAVSPALVLVLVSHLRVHRYSPTHTTVKVTLGGRGLLISRNQLSAQSPSSFSGAGRTERMWGSSSA